MIFLREIKLDFLFHRAKIILRESQEETEEVFIN